MKLLTPFHIPLQVLFPIALTFTIAELNADESFSPAPAPRPVVLLDYYHRTPKQTTIGQHLLTGSYSDTVGRYRTDDFSHTNSYDSFLNALERDYDLRVHETPLTKGNLNGTDIVMLINPEKPTARAHVPVLSNEEIADLVAFTEQGGTVVALLNSVGAAGTEDFEIPQMRKLVNAFGVDWNNTNTEYSDIPIGPRHGYFYDIPVFHYGAGCTLRFLPGAQSPEVLLNVKEDNGAAEVRGPGIVLVRKGRGKFLCIGDTGSWGGGNMSRPWAENRRFLNQLFAYAKRSHDVAPPLSPPSKNLHYRVQIGLLNVIPTGNPLAAAPQPEMETYTPRPRTGIPFMEVECTLDVAPTDSADPTTHRFQIGLHDLRRAGQPVAAPATESFAIETTRQGSVVGIESHGERARWLAAELGCLFAFIPNDAVRIGDRWRKIQELRINPARGAEAATTRPVETEMLYLRDETLAGHDCRVFRSQAEVWLSDIGAGADDIVPFEVARQPGGDPFELMANRGGRILFKREQWIDVRTGVVVKAVSQTRLLAWLHRKGEPLPQKTAQKDDLMMVALASMATFELQP